MAEWKRNKMFPSSSVCQDIFVMYEPQYMSQPDNTIE